LRPVVSIGASILTMAAGSAIIGLAVAGITMASIVGGGGPAAGPMAEGRSVAAVAGWGQAGVGRELYSPRYVEKNSGEPEGAGARWAPRGEALICRSWCMVGGAECFDVCRVARGQ